MLFKLIMKQVNKGNIGKEVQTPLCAKLSQITHILQANNMTLAPSVAKHQ